MKKKKVIHLIVGVTILLIILIGGFYSNNQIKILKQQIIKQNQLCTAQLAKNEEESRYLLTDTAKPLEKTLVPYSFHEFGIYSPLFEDKTITEEQYLYKRTQFKKMTVTVSKLTTGSNMPSEKDSDYLVEVWEYPNPNEIDNSISSLNIPRVVTDFSTMIGTSVIPLNQITDAWNNKSKYTNNHSLTLHVIPYASGSPYISALESYVGISPNGNPHFLRVRPRPNIYLSGTFSYDSKNSDFLKQITKNLKEIGDTLSYTQY